MPPRKSLSPAERLLYSRIDEILFYRWDPIGVSEHPRARTEYESYTPLVFALVNEAAPEAEIAECLMSIASENIGLGRNPTRAGEVARELVEVREYIADLYG